MFIGIDVSHANKKNRTGVEEYCFQIIQHLKKITPSDVRVVLYCNVPLSPELGVLPSNWSVKILKWPFKKLWSQTRLAYELWRNPPDVYFAPGQLLPFFASKNSVVMVHDSAFETVPYAYGFLSRMYLKFMNRIIARKTKKILVSAEFNEKEFLRYYKFNGDIRIIPLAYDKQKFNLNGAKKTDLGRYILSVGRLEEKKNTKRVVSAFNVVKKQVPDLKLVLVGRPGAGYVQVKQAIEQSEFKKDILELNSATVDEVAEYMRGALAFVFPSLYEGFGLPSLEAMACGTPVVASRGSAMEEVCGDVAEYCDPRDEKDMAEKVLKIINDNTLRQEKIFLGLKKSAEFSWEKTAEQTLKEILN